MRAQVLAAGRDPCIIGDVLENDSPPVDAAAFPATRWTIVSMARGDDGEAARRALEELCGAYWYPLYAFVRRRGLSPDDAEDAVQAFFLSLLERASLARADRERGRLRSFLLGALKHFLAERRRYECAAKRGGGVRTIDIDREWAEEILEGGLGQGPEVEDFDREWACTVLDRVFARLEVHHRKRGREKVFEVLKGCLTGDADYGDGAAVAEELGLSSAGVRSAVFQMRQRFRRYLEEEVRDTVGDENELRDELVYLCRVLADHPV